MSTRSRRRFVSILAGVLGCSTWSATAWAHAIVVSATPAAHTTVTGSRVPIDLEFNSRIDVTRSRLSLIDAAQHARELAIDPAAPPNRIRALAVDVAPGDQLLEWYVLSADGHITRGRLKFKVQAGP